MRIIILYTGNSCRSQMAYGYLHSLDNYMEVCSAGIHPAEQVNSSAISAVQEIGIDMSTHDRKGVKQYLAKSGIM